MIAFVEKVYTDKPIDATSRLASGPSTVPDCSTTTPPWLDELAREIGEQERRAKESRIAEIANMRGQTPALQAEMFRHTEEIRVGRRSAGRTA